MKIGITGSVIVCSTIQKIIKNKFPDQEVILLSSNIYQDAVELADRLQNMGVSGIIFTGPTNYNYALKRLEPTVPWTYIPHNQASMMKALLEACIRFSCVPDVISVDMYEEELILDTMDAAGITEKKILSPKGLSPEDPDFETRLLDFHRMNYLLHGAKVCFTNMEHICQPLMDEGIPCIRFSTTEDVVMEQLYHLQMQELSARENRGTIATVQIYFDFSFDQETDLSVREWEKIHFQNEMKELIYSAAHRMGAAAFCEGPSLYYIVTNRRVLMNQFLQNGEFQQLLSHGQKTPYNRIWIGFGIGSTPLESKSRASMALNHSIADRSGSFYIVENEHQAEGLRISKPMDHSAFLVQQLHLSDATFQRLKEILSLCGDRITSAQLAEQLGITERSVNRLIQRLEQMHCVTTVGKISCGKGRPARVMKIVLP